MKKILKRKPFLIDKITEDSFYENLLLGMPSLLKACQFVTQITLERLQPATLEEVKYWEAINEVCLPEDLRNFFLSTNGFSFTYKFHYEKAEHDENESITAGIEINPLIKIEKIQTPETWYLIGGSVKMVSPYVKCFHLTNIDEDNWVVLAQFNPPNPPNFWVYYKLKIFCFLCEDIATYFRMALAHVGVPGWQLQVLGASLPEWSAELIQILAPGVFDNRQLVENKSNLNKIDCDLFNTESDLQLTSESFYEEEKEKAAVSENVSKKKSSPKSKPKK